MNEFVARVATTHIVSQGGVNIRFPREGIEQAANDINHDKESIPVIPNHDPFSMPIGKVKEAWVEPFGEEFALMHRIQFEDSTATVIHARTGTEMIRLDFNENPKPVKTKAYGDTSEHLVTLSVDLANFTNIDDYEAFQNDVKVIDVTIKTDKSIVRHSLIPEPIVQFIAAEPGLTLALAIGTWFVHRAEKFVRYTVDETLRKIADDISDSLSAKIKKAIKAYVNRRSGDKRTITLQLVVPGNLELVLLLKVKPDNPIPDIDLPKLVDELEAYGELLQQARSATIALEDNKTYKLRYVTLRSGEVIGTRECFDYTMNVYSSMASQQNTGVDEDSPGD